MVLYGKACDVLHKRRLFNIARDEWSSAYRPRSAAASTSKASYHRQFGDGGIKNDFIMLGLERV